MRLVLEPRSVAVSFRRGRMYYIFPLQNMPIFSKISLLQDYKLCVTSRQDSRDAMGILLWEKVGDLTVKWGEGGMGIGIQ